MKENQNILPNKAKPINENSPTNETHSGSGCLSSILNPTTEMHMKSQTPHTSLTHHSFHKHLTPHDLQPSQNNFPENSLRNNSGVLPSEQNKVAHIANLHLSQGRIGYPYSQHHNESIVDRVNNDNASGGTNSIAIGIDQHNVNSYHQNKNYSPSEFPNQYLNIALHHVGSPPYFIEGIPNEFDKNIKYNSIHASSSNISTESIQSFGDEDPPILEPNSDSSVLCCIRGCNRKASVRNFNSLKTDWEIKPELKNDNKLKICTTCYNVDLKRKKQHDNKQSMKRKRCPSESPQQSPEVINIPTRRKRGMTEMGNSVFLDHIGIIFSLSQDAWLKYNLTLLHSILSAQDLQNKVLFFENNEERYQLFLSEDKNTNCKNYTWGKILSPSQKNDYKMMMKGLPLLLENDFIQLHCNISLQDISWSDEGVLIGGNMYKILRMKVLPIMVLNT